jgi:hypothetical protein
VKRAIVLPLLLVACAGPSRAEMDAHVEEAKRIQAAGAVHMPPAGVDSCVGITVRLTEDTPGNERERKALLDRISEAEVAAALKKAGAPRCAESFREEALAQGLTNEPLRVKAGYAIDPNGKVCAVVERSRMDPIDPAAVPLLDLAAGCLKDALFRAQFPAGRVIDQERIVRFSSVDLTMVETVTSTTTKR